MGLFKNTIPPQIPPGYQLTPIDKNVQKIVNSIVFILMAIVFLQFGFGVWWISTLSTQVMNQQIRFEEKFNTIKGTMLSSTDDRITKSEANAKFELYTLKLEAIANELNKNNDTDKSEHKRLENRHDMLKDKFSSLEEQLIDLERTITQIYTRMNQKRK